MKADVIGRISMALFNNTQHEHIGYSITTGETSYAYAASNVSQFTEHELESFKKNDEWHKVVIDAQANGNVKYQIYHNEALKDEYVMKNEKTHFGDLRFFASYRGMEFKNVKITQPIVDQNSAA